MPLPKMRIRHGQIIYVNVTEVIDISTRLMKAEKRRSFHFESCEKPTCI